MKKLLISILALVMSVTLALGIGACSNGASDEEIATKAIDTINLLYANGAASTPDDYTVIAKAKVDDKLYPIVWSVSPDTAKDYVKIGTPNETANTVTIDITRTTVDVDYKLTASVTVGDVTKTAEYTRKIPKEVVVNEDSVGFDFKSAVAGGLALDNASALAYFNSWASQDTPLTNITTATKVYQGNGQGGGDLEYAGGFVKMGTSSAKGVLKLTFAYPVVKVDIEARGWNDSDTLSVNDGAAQTLSTSADVVSFEFGATKDVTITSTNRAILYRIVATWDKDVHRHTWTYEQGSNFTHKRTCTGEGCTLTEKTETVPCAVIGKTCTLCKTTYTDKQIVDGLYALEAKASLPGVYELSGRVTSISEQSTSFGNATCVITVDGREITVYRVAGEGYDTFKVGDTLTVSGSLTNYDGTYEFTQGCYIVSVVDGSATMTDAAKVAAEKTVLSLDASNLKKAGDSVTLPATGTYGTTLAWAVETNNYLEVSGGKLTVKALPASGSANVKVTVTITSGSASDSKEFTVTLQAESAATDGFTPITAPAAGSDYYLAMDIKGTWYYSTGAKSGNYLGTTKDISKAAKVTVAASGSGWTLVTNGKYIEFETSAPNASGKTYVNIMLKNAQTAGKVWMWNAEHSVFTMDEGGETYFLGTYGNFDTFNSANITFIENDNEYIGKIGTYTGTVEPEPELPDPTKGTEIVTEGATVFDFSGVQVPAADNYDEMTDAAILTAFNNFEGLTVTKSKIYAGNNNATSGPEGYRSKGGFLRMGSGSANGTLTLTFTKDITKVQILCLGWSATDTIAINGFAPATIGNTAQVAYTYTLTDAVKSFTITTAKRALIFKLAVTFADGGSVEPQPQPENNGTAEHPFTPSEAVAYGKLNLATNGATTTAEVYVKGYVIDKGSWNGTCWQYVYIADDTSTKTNQLDVVIEVYKLYPDSTYLMLSGDLVKGREITVHGYLKNYTDKNNKTTYEFDNYTKDGTEVHPVASFASTLTREEKLNVAKTAVGNLASDDVIAGFNLPAVTVSGVSYAWTVTPTTYAQIVTEQNVSKLQITRPENGTGNQTVTLSLTITCDGTEEQTPLTWELTIKQKPSTTTESELYVLPTAHQTSGSNNSYTGNCDVTYNGVKWNIEGNSQSSPWRFGGKASNDTTPLTADRKLTGKTAIQGKVSKVLLTLTDGGGITVNSVTLKVYKTDPTSNGAEAVSTKTVTTYTKGETITFTAEEGEDWTNCYFEITFNVTITSTSNKYVAISNLEFRGTAVEE